MNAHITVTAVSDEGDSVIVWGRPDNAPPASEPNGYAFQAKGNPDTVALAEQASRLTAGTEVIIEYTTVVDGWHLAYGITVESHDG